VAICDAKRDSVLEATKLTKGMCLRRLRVSAGESDGAIVEEGAAEDEVAED
jgi:hypothetical protein